MKITSFARRLIALLSVISIMTIPAGSAAASYRDNSSGTLLQFTSGGHVLGFDNNGVYMAGLDHTLNVEFAGGHAVQPISESAGSAIEDIKELTRITYNNAWNHIDIIYSSVSGGIAESTYVLRPGANPADIRLRYNTPIKITADGGLSFTFENGSLTESAPIAWQETGGQRTPVEVSFIQQDVTQAGFALGNYDKKYTVYIDPTYEWHTFYGDYSDGATGITTDSSGNIYLSAESYGTWNGPAGQTPLHDYTPGAGSTSDICVIKLNSAGAYQWHTFFGGIAIDQSPSIKLDASGNIYVAGQSFATWDGPDAQSPMHAHSGSECDLVVIKLSNAGSYLWHTFYGGQYFDQCSSMSLDSAGNILVAGASQATWNGPGGQAPLHPHSPIAYDTDMVVLKLSSAGGYLWHTFDGGTGYDMVNGMVLDANNNVYLAGYSSNTWNGQEGQAPLHAYTSTTDMAVLKLSSAGSYLWHTFYGATSNDSAYCITADSSGNVYIGGSSENSWNGPTGQAPLNAHSTGSNSDMTILKLSNAGDYLWHAFYGSTEQDIATSITTDRSWNLYIGGFSGNNWSGPNGQSPLNAHSSGANLDIIALNLSSAGTYGWHTYYGSTNMDLTATMTLNSSNNIFIAGASWGTWNGPAGQAPLHAFASGGNYNIFLVQMRSDTPSITTVNPASGKQRETCEITITGTNLSAATSVSFGEGIRVSSYTVNSNTRITANIVISPNAKPGLRNVVVTTPPGIANKGAAFKVLGQESTSTPIGSGSMPAPTQTAAANNPQSIPTTAIANIVVQGASVSTTAVSPNTPVTVTADISNRGTANGSKKVTVYVNGEIETTLGVNIDSNGSSQLTFSVSRSEPGEYSVYVDGTPAGSFKVEAVTANDTVLIVSVAFLSIAFVCGLIMLRRRQSAGR